MRKAFFTIFLLFSAALLAEAQTSFYGTEDVGTFREGRDKEFRSRKDSPLLEEDFSKFKGLNYYPVADDFRVAARFTTTPDEKYFMMPTTSGRSMKYVKVGLLTFKLEGREHSLSVFQSEKAEIDPVWKEKYGHAYFIPFRDLTNGKETYSGGRYIYMKIPEGEGTVLDFNLTFNPSCAYGSDRYSCPIPPKENFLRAEIRAGEKIFDYTGKKK